jgi:serine/threonine protein kinase
MNYYIKYLKYKSKYKKLIKIIGGGISSNIIITNEKQDAIKFNKMNLEGKHMQVIYLNKINNTKSIDNFIISKVIGDGAFGKVYMIIDKKDNKQYVIKVNISTNDQDHSNSDEGILTEKLSNILSEDSLAKFQGTDPFDYVIYYYHGLNLKKIYVEKSTTYKVNNIKYILYQLYIQLNKLNSNNLFHNDIKEPNISISESESGKPILKLLDFGSLNHFSTMGTWESMCVKGIINFVLTEYQKKIQPMSSVLYNINNIKNFNFKSTDFVAFFNLCIQGISKINNSIGYIVYDNYSNLLGFNDANYSLDNLNKLIYFYYFISSHKHFWGNFYEISIEYQIFIDISKRLENILPKMDEVNLIFNNDKYPEIDMNKKYNNLKRYLCYIYNNIYDKIDINVITIDNLPLFLWRLSICLEENFDVNQFDFLLITDGIMNGIIGD